MHMPALQGIISRASGAGGAGCVVSVEKVSVTMPVGTPAVSINLTKGQDPDKCVPFFSGRWNAHVAQNGYVPQGMCSIDIYNNSGTAAVQVERRTDDYAAKTVVVYVVEFNNDVAVQKIAHTGAGIGYTAACTAVDQSRAFIIGTARTTGTGAGDDVNDWATRYKFNSDTEVSIANVYNSPSYSLQGHLYIVEDITAGGDHFTVEAHDHTSNSTNSTKAITSVTSATTMLVSSYASTETSSGHRTGCSRVRLDSDSLLRFYRTDTSDTNAWTVFVVYWHDGTSVQRGSATNTCAADSAAGSQNIGISDVDTDLSIAKFTQQFSMHPCGTTPTSTNVASPICSTIQVDADGDGIDLNWHNPAVACTIDFEWEVVEFEAA